MIIPLFENIYYSSIASFVAVSLNILLVLCAVNAVSSYSIYPFPETSIILHDHKASTKESFSIFKRCPQ